jgi:nucleoside-diphosphate-sugar epimerase
MKNAAQVVREDSNYVCENLELEFKRLGGKKLLLTGGAGFLGYNFVNAIAGYNQTAEIGAKIAITIYDNFIRGMPQWLKAFEKDVHINVVRHDITAPLPDGMPEFEYIIHAASIASPIYYRKFPIETMDANVNGLRTLLEYCHQQQNCGTPVEGFLFFSTSEVYGDPPPEYIPTAETFRGNVSCTGPRACYDESKRYGETLCVNFARQYDLPIKIARPFNNYGPGLKISDRRVIPDFSRDIMAQRDLVLLSDGSPTRTFCYVADALVGYFKILIRGQAGEAYNIGVGSPEISMVDLADRIVRISRDLFGYNGKLVRKVSRDKDYLVDNPNRRCPDISKARNTIGYNPSISLDEGLRRSLIWYSEYKEGSDA